MQAHIPGILILRPTEQAQETIRQVKLNSWNPVHFPTVEIVASKTPHNAQVFSRLAEFDWLIFVSQNAVKHFLAQLQQLPVKMPNIATVGKATSLAAEKAGLSVTLQPDGPFSSEGLLNMPAFQQVQNQRVLIVRGNGGRELLADTLARRGATVSYADVYLRRLPEADSNWLTGNWSDRVNVILATSNQLLDNLVQLTVKTLGQQLYLTPLIVISPRMQQHAGQLGFKKIWLAEGPSNDQMMATIRKNLLLI